MKTWVKGRVVQVDAAWARAQVGRSKGGRTAQARGTGYRFNSDTGRKAARRLWDRRYKLNKPTGVRLGYPRHRRPAVNHAALRTLYASGTPGWAGCNPIWYNPITKLWQVDEYGCGNRVLTERTALRRLGHLPFPKNRGMVPERMK